MAVADRGGVEEHVGVFGSGIKTMKKIFTQQSNNEKSVCIQGGLISEQHHNRVRKDNNSGGDHRRDVEEYVGLFEEGKK